MGNESFEDLTNYHGEELPMETAAATKVAFAVVRQAHRDLGDKCKQIRVSAVEFFHSNSPWVEMLNLHQDFVLKRIEGDIESARRGTCAFKTLKSGSRRCPTCRAHPEDVTR